MRNDEQFYITSDLGLATTLFTLGFLLDSLDRNNPSRVEFIFGQKDGIEDAVESYWRNELKVNPLAFFQNIKQIKNQIYSR